MFQTFQGAWDSNPTKKEIPVPGYYYVRLDIGLSLSLLPGGKHEGTVIEISSLSVTLPMISWWFLANHFVFPCSFKQGIMLSWGKISPRRTRKLTVTGKFVLVRLP